MTTKRRSNLLRAHFPRMCQAMMALGLGIGCQSEPREASEVQADEQLVAAIREALAAPETPEDALRAYQERVGEVLREHDAAEADAIAAASLLEAIEDEDDLQALARLTERVNGRVYVTPEPRASGGSAEPRELTAVCPGVGEPNVVYFVNGIGTGIFEALDHSVNLMNAVKRFDGGFDGSFRLFYNASGPDGHEAVCNELGLKLDREDLPEDTRTRVRAVAEAWCDETGIVLDFAQALGQYLSVIRGEEHDSALTENLVDLTVADVMGGKKVIVVAHSQGNFYARELADALATVETPSGETSPARAIGIVSTASPVSFDARLRSALGGFSSVQVRRDVITAIPGSPTWNTENVHSWRVDAAITDATVDSLLLIAQILLSGWSPRRVVDLVEVIVDHAQVMRAAVATHRFGTSYLGPETGPVVAEAVTAMAASLVNDRPLAGQGELQIMLTWDTPGDIDLHVLEPDGSHVYWAARQGTTGQLDRDDIVGRGPENFYVCERESVAIGEYAVGVNNFGGRAGTEVEVYVRAGDELRRLTTSVGAADGGQTILGVATVSFDGESFAIVGQ